MVLSYSGYYTGLSSRISGFDSPQDRQVNADSGWVGAQAPHSRFPQRFDSFGLLQLCSISSRGRIAVL